jgi:hypothetical protein
VPAEDPDLLGERLAELARALRLAELTDSLPVATARLIGWLRERDRWLRVFDNAEYPAALSPYLPGGEGHVVITSRNPGWREVAQSLPIDVFTRDESVAVLHGRSPRSAPRWPTGSPTCWVIFPWRWRRPQRSWTRPSQADTLICPCSHLVPTGCWLWAP